MEAFKKLMDKKKKDKPMSDIAKDAKMSVVKDLSDMASKAMKSGLKGGVKKVSVLSDTKEGLEAGLKKAEDLVDSKKFGSMDEMMESEPGEELAEAEEELPISPDEGEENLEECSEEEIDEKLAKLMDMKKKMQAKKA